MQFLNFLTSLLTRPHPNINDPEKVQRSRLLSTILLVLIFAGITILAIVLLHDSEDIMEPTVQGASILLGIILFMYILSRLGFTSIPAMGGILSFITIFIYIPLYSGEEPVFLAFLLIPIILAAIFFSLKMTTIMSIGILLLLPILMFIAGITPEDRSYWNLRNMWFFLFLSTGLLAAFKSHLGNVEQIRIQELKTMNERLEQKVVERTDELQRELNERKKLVTELEMKNDELKRFTYTVSHDLKAPLVTIRGFLGYLEKDILSGNPQRIKCDMDRIASSTDKMQKLLEGLLKLSRAGRTIDQPETASLETIIRDAISLLEGQINEKGVQVEVADGLPEIYGDPTRLTQVLQNLIDNAVKFMGDQKNPGIEIGQQKLDNEDTAIFFVKDNGAGIAPEHLEHVFGLFDKLDTHAEGTGIGLATVKRIIEAHGGRTWVESGGVGKGSTFCFTIPQKGTSHEYQ